nr:increased DNA methylation 1-like [Ipomoea batatas]
MDHSCVESFPGIWECVRDLINCIEKMLSSFKFEKLVKSAIPSLVKILALGFAFKPLEEEERSSLSNNNLMLFPRTMWLKTYVSSKLEKMHKAGTKDALRSKEVDPAISELKLENLELGNGGGNSLHNRWPIYFTKGSVSSQASL